MIIVSWYPLNHGPLQTQYFDWLLNHGQLHKGPWLRKKMAGNLCFAKVLTLEGILSRKPFPENLKTTKYNPKTFNGRKQVLNPTLIVNLLLYLQKNVTRRRAGGITEHIHIVSRLCILAIQAKLMNFQLLVVT